jgi:hypothetical protein
MSEEKSAKDSGKNTGKNTGQTSKPCADDSQPKTELDGKNDSGPEPEVHGRDIPSQ